MQITDSHIHVWYPIPSGPADRWDFGDFLAQSQQAGVHRFFCNGTRPADWEAVVAVGRKHPGVFPCLGLHPWFVGDPLDGKDGFDAIDLALGRLESLLDSPAVEPLCGYKIGVGEIGLDRAVRVPTGATRLEIDRLQEHAFAQQLAIANARGLPVMIHGVRATGRVLGHLRKNLPDLFLLHGFTGSAESVSEFTESGAFFSFSARAFQAGGRRGLDALRTVPVDRILLETDAPDHSTRTSVLECVDDLPKLVGRIAEYRQVTIDGLRRQIVENTERFLERWPRIPKR